MASTLCRNLAQNLRRERKRRHLSQEELAALIGLHRTYVGGIERGERNITLSTLEKIAAGIGTDPLHLLRDPD